MLIQQRFIVPGLGAVILLSAFLLGVPLVYEVLLAVLGLAAAATYFAPSRVQLETRIVIAALGLIILLITGSIAFLLTLLSFGAIAALQFPHRHTLRRSSATIAWLNVLLKRRRGPHAADEDKSEVGLPSREAPAMWALKFDQLPGFVRLNVAGVGSAISGVVTAVSVFMPWVFVLATVDGESATFSFTLRAWAKSDDDPAVTAFFAIVLVLGLLSVAAIALPRVAAAIIAVLGLVVTIISYFYLFGRFEDALQGELPSWVDMTLLPQRGALLAAVGFLVMLVLQLIPGVNQSRGKEQEKES